MDILYLCDRRACTHCSAKCIHTKDIFHAKHFINKNGKLIEHERKPVIFKMQSIVKQDVLENIYQQLIKESEKGVILLSHYIEPITIDVDDVTYEIREVKKKGV